jgi:hypothetical protein
MRQTDRFRPREEARNGFRKLSERSVVAHGGGEREDLVEEELDSISGICLQSGLGIRPGNSSQPHDHSVKKKRVLTNTTGRYDWDRRLPGAKGRTPVGLRGQPRSPVYPILLSAGIRG